MGLTGHRALGLKAAKTVAYGCFLTSTQLQPYRALGLKAAKTVARVARSITDGTPDARHSTRPLPAADGSSKCDSMAAASNDILSTPCVANTHVTHGSTRGSCTC
jgi:hypothetical protein